MPGIALVARDTTHPRSADEMCRQESHVHLSAEEELAAEDSLSVYCKPVELYNILQRRTFKNPSFLQRCLGYKIQAKHKRRIRMSIALSGTMVQGIQSQSLFPLYVFLARVESDVSNAEYSAVYRYSRACLLTSFMGAEGHPKSQATFILPEINKLELEAKSGSLAIVLLCQAGTERSFCDLAKSQQDLISFTRNVGGYCALGSIPMESVYLSWEKSRNLSLGQRAEVTFCVDMRSCIIKLGTLTEDKHIFVEVPKNSEALSAQRQIRVVVCAEEVGAKEKSPYSSYICNEITSSSLSNIICVRAGNVIFNYKYYSNKLQQTEVTEDFTCPFCLVKCASFKGLRYHLSSSHDLFNFEFWVTEDYQAVNVSVRADMWMSEVVADCMDPKLQTFFFCSKPLKRRRSINRIAKHVHPLFLESELRTGVCDLLNRADDAHSSRGDKARMSGVASATGQSYADTECVQSVFANNLAPSAMLQFAKTRKLSFERSEPRNRLLLQKRQFFHSHRAQPMALEQVMSDRDSEDEVDDDVADFEDRRMLDDFVDVTKDEKQMMHLWNSFVRKQRVLADGHIPWACEAFSRLHGHDLVRAPALFWCWRLFMIKLWNHGLLDARTMNNCNIILEQFQNEGSDQMKS
ncbi:hypothetical protein CDL15_Pgr022840 [Punica granatum]|uniref:Uncharacterized protein n=2 Tax=Punica granatum TaxID=22663 RepID=A0A218X3S7_PUNGR|nr:hypothetical protein CDL15_Pgr022840 [Punica granatum]